MDGTLLLSSGEYAAAEACYRRSLTLYEEKCLSTVEAAVEWKGHPGHIPTADCYRSIYCYGNLALVCSLQGKVGEAVGFYRVLENRGGVSRYMGMISSEHQVVMSTLSEADTTTAGGGGFDLVRPNRRRRFFLERSPTTSSPSPKKTQRQKASAAGERVRLLQAEEVEPDDLQRGTEAQAARDYTTAIGCYQRCLARKADGLTASAHTSNLHHSVTPVMSLTDLIAASSDVSDSRFQCQCVCR